MGSMIFQYFAAVSGTTSVVLTGLHYGWPSPTLPELLADNSTIPITQGEGSMLAIMLLIGAAVGCVTGAYLADLIGRKWSALTTAPLFSIGGLMIIFAESILVLHFARFISGVADGMAFTVMPMYLGEIASPKIRGFLGTSVHVTLIFGILLINILGAFLDMRQCGIILAAAPLLFAASFAFMPESPYYLIKKKKLMEAKRSLQVFRGTDDVEEELSQLREAVRNQEENHGGYLDLFRVKSNRQALLIMMGLRSVQQFSGNAAFTFYTKMIFEEGGGHISSSWSAVIYTAVQVTMSFFSSIIVDKAGRRPLLMISTLGASVALIIEGFYFLFRVNLNMIGDSYTWIALVSLIGYILSFALGLGTIPILMLGELFPTGVKGPALSFMGVYFSIIATIVTKFYQVLANTWGVHVAFFSFALFCWIGAAFIYTVVPETKGKTLEEIQQELRSRHPSKRRR